MKTNYPSPFLYGSSEIELHYKRPLFEKMINITGANDAEKILRNYIHPGRIDFKECFWVLLLSNANRLIGIAEVASGHPNQTCVPVREIFQLALITNSVNLIVAHNHCSGNLNPSKADRDLTKRLATCSKWFGMTLLDHIIITSESCRSFAREGEL